jgi:hypothetical protein
MMVVAMAKSEVQRSGPIDIADISITTVVWIARHSPGWTDTLSLCDRSQKIQ